MPPFDKQSVAICIPTMNAADLWAEFSSRLRTQHIPPHQILVLDSESIDGTSDLARAEGFEVQTILRKDFRHGATRQIGVEYFSAADFIVFLTQDAMLASPDSIANLLRPFEEPSVGAVYGRQLPRNGAGLIEAHARNFNYPAHSALRSLEDVPEIGFKSIFFSDSFGAYRRDALQQVGGFPLDVNFGEDTVVAARMLMAGWKVAYAAEAEAFHSHGYTIAEEYRRYIDIGLLHGNQPWLLEKFGGVGGEGGRLMKSQLSLLARKAPLQIPGAIGRAAAKWFGYRKGIAKSAVR